MGSCRYFYNISLSVELQGVPNFRYRVSELLWGSATGFPRRYRVAATGRRSAVGNGAWSASYQFPSRRLLRGMNASLNASDSSFVLRNTTMGWNKLNLGNSAPSAGGQKSQYPELARSSHFPEPFAIAKYRTLALQFAKHEYNPRQVWHRERTANFRQSAGASRNKFDTGVNFTNSGRISQTSQNILTGQTGKSFQNIFRGVTCTEVRQHRLDGNSCSLDNGLAVTNIR